MRNCYGKLGLLKLNKCDLENVGNIFFSVTFNMKVPTPAA